MSLPGLIDSVSVEATPDGRQLGDSATGAVLPLSEGELRLLEAWDGRVSAVELAAKALSIGVDVDAGQVEAFFSRMSRIGVLGRPPPVVPGAVVPPLGVKGEADIVPSFRSDLKLEPAQGTRGVIHVVDPVAQVTFTLYDFEVSVARMLNGQRSASQVLEAADRIGVPLTLASLRAFIGQLRAFRFLDSKPVRRHTTWKPRKVWSDEVRELYQQALKLARRGDRHDAMSCLESVLELDPMNEDAIALNARLGDTSGRPAIGTSFDLLHAKAPPEVVGPAMKPEYPLAQGMLDPFEALEPVVDPAVPQPQALGSGPALWPTSGPEVTADDLSLSQRQEAMTRKRTFWPMITLASVLTLGLAGLFYPVVSINETSCSVDLLELASLRAPSAGVVRFEAKPGQLVSVGQVVARMGKAGGGDLDVPALEKRLAEANQKKAKLSPAPAAKVSKAQKRLALAKAQLEPLAAQREKLAAQKGPAAAKKLAAFDKTLRAKEAAVAKERAEVEDLTHAQALAAIEKTIADTKRDLEAAPSGSEPADIVATQAGQLVVEPTPVGSLAGGTDVVPKGTVVGRLVSPTLKVTPKQGAPRASGRITVMVGSEQLEARVDGSRLFIEGDASLAGKPCMVTMPEGRRPWVLTLLR